MSQILESFINRRILIVDDLPAIHDDFRKILGPVRTSARLEAAEERLFGTSPPRRTPTAYALTFAAQGEDAVRHVEDALRRGQPFSVAFVDMRMPPGIDGADTIARIWNIDPRIEIVVCTAYADRSQEEMVGLLGRSEGLLVLKKPFDVVEVQQMADALTQKWTMSRMVRRQQEELARRSSTAPGVAREPRVPDAAVTAEAAFIARLARLACESGLELCEHPQPLADPTGAGAPRIAAVRRRLAALAIATGTWAGRASLADIGALFNGVADGLRADAAATGCLLCITVPAGARRVVDVALLDLIADHLLANAVRCSAGGTVHVSLDLSEPSSLHVRILDTGPGLPALVRAWLDQAAPTPYGAVGGLVVVLRALHALQATWKVRARVGGGTEWELQIPAPAGTAHSSS